MPRLRALALLSLVLVAGCAGDGGTGENGTSMEGLWVGGAIDNQVFLQLSMTLTETGKSLAGSGTISVPGFGCDVTVSGSRNGTGFNLSMGCQGFQSWTYSGTANTSTLVGKFNGSGFSNFNFTMGRK